VNARIDSSGRSVGLGIDESMVYLRPRGSDASFVDYFPKHVSNLARGRHLIVATCDLQHDQADVELTLIPPTASSVHVSRTAEASSERLTSGLRTAVLDGSRIDSLERSAVSVNLTSP
jgi:hypothetical protein